MPVQRSYRADDDDKESQNAVELLDEIFKTVLALFEFIENGNNLKHVVAAFVLTKSVVVVF